MKQRLITGLLWGSLAVLTMIKIYTPMMGIIIAIFSMIAVHEIEKAANVKNVPIIALSIIFAGVLPFATEYDLLVKFNIPLAPVMIAYTIILLSLMLAKFETTRFEHVAVVLVASVCVPWALSTFMLLRDVYKLYPDKFLPSQAFYLFFLAISCAWATDMFAYFVGSKYGKHKMSPKISPKKSIEGAVGGIILTIFFNLISLYIFSTFVYKTFIMSYWLLIPISIALSIIGMLGDLSASVIKRNYGVKDFGSIMKGHGGIMDRFDSCVFIFPSLYGFIMLTQSF
ncbi:MAG: phosphatidate cytidylyltransferase [Clostridiales bacterium]|nr:phosphatidate cytidylyltransferase [Clostridiales bacterium]